MTPSKNWRLDGKMVLVTGGSEGIGFAIAKEFIELGAEVLITSRSKIKLEKASAEISSPKISWVAADLSTPMGRELLYQRVLERGELDILVNNLGQADRGSFLEMNQSRI
ncbi:MAG: SDR family oxidoreductase [Bdellovibrionales bacterium]|nr:SDR family oxidoreductase [Bdellovibrionales bacterium]